MKRDGGVKGQEGGGKRRIDSLLRPLGDQFSSAWHSNRTRDHVTEDELGSSRTLRYRICLDQVRSLRDIVACRSIAIISLLSRDSKVPENLLPWIYTRFFAHVLAER